VPAQPRDDRRGHGGNNAAGNHRHNDRRRDVEHPGDPDDEEGGADEEPRRDTQITQPARRGKDGRELPELVGVELDDDLLDVLG